MAMDDLPVCRVADNARVAEDEFQNALIALDLMITLVAQRGPSCDDAMIDGLGYLAEQARGHVAGLGRVAHEFVDGGAQ